MATTRIARELLVAGIIEEFELDRAKRGERALGRPKVGLRIAACGLFAAGITVSAYHSEVSICDANGQLVASRKVQDIPLFDAVQTGRHYAKALRALIDESGFDLQRFVGIGVALSARTDPVTGRIVMSEYFGWGEDNGGFCEEVRNVINLPVEIENIANALAIAEMRFGSARDLSEFTLIHAATFVGAGVVSDSRLVRGVSGISGLIGHFRTAEQPLTCVCGRHDCLNLAATGFSLLSRLGLLDHQVFDRSKLSFYASTILDKLADEASVTPLREAGSNLALAVDNIVKLLGPERVILSGHLGTNEDYFEGARQALEEQYGVGNILVRGEISSVRSAALLALHAYCYLDRLDYDRFAETAPAKGRSHG
ncbi:MAG: ROK family protein [Silicimonas sp.]|uniref:ROK family protein n=2 Tax=Pseudomonadota TaxID=1224 RepID=UPI0032EBEB1F